MPGAQLALEHLAGRAEREVVRRPGDHDGGELLAAGVRELLVGAVEDGLLRGVGRVGLELHDRDRLPGAVGAGYADHRAVQDQVGAVGEQDLLDGQAVDGTGRGVDDVDGPVQVVEPALASRRATSPVSHQPLLSNDAVSRGSFQ